MASDSDAVVFARCVGASIARAAVFAGVDAVTRTGAELVPVCEELASILDEPCATSRFGRGLTCLSETILSPEADVAGAALC